MQNIENLHVHEKQYDIPCVVKEAFWDQLANSVVIGNDNLLPLGVYMLSKQFAQVRDVGVKTVAGDQIKGIVGMRSDFDDFLLPRQAYIRHRWTDEDRKRFEDATFPHISLLKIRDSYFVMDGRHRLSPTTISNHTSLEGYVVEVEQDHEC